MCLHRRPGGREGWGKVDVTATPIFGVVPGTAPMGTEGRKSDLSVLSGESLLVLSSTQCYCWCRGELQESQA